MELNSQSKKPTVGIIYYTNNFLDPKIFNACQKQILKASNGLKIVSVSLKPIDFGEKNIVMPLQSCRLTMFKQILTALENIDTDIVFFCEHDVLYHPSHFDFLPTKKDTFYYNTNFWFLRFQDGFTLFNNVSPLSGMCVYRESALSHYRERVEMVEKDGFSYNMGYEPMTHNRIPWKNQFKSEYRQSAFPNIDIRHGRNTTKSRWTTKLFWDKPTVWIEGTIDTLPGWPNIKELLK